jgi:ASTRA-associated protein 1
MAQGPAVPAFILRGHLAPVHCLMFFGANAYLASGDSEGWIVIWSLASKRPIAVWRAHIKGVTGIRYSNRHGLLTHGRDHKLRAWKLDFSETAAAILSKTLPVEGAGDDQAQPWLLHSMDMSALNFSTFAICEISADELLIASPNGLDHGGVDIFQLPSQRRISQLHSDKETNTGMVMSLALLLNTKPQSLELICGYEDGQVALYSSPSPLFPHETQWQRLVLVRLHSQPVMSLCVSATSSFFVTSSADAQIAKVSVDTSRGSAVTQHPKITNTKHAGQQGLSIRSDDKIFATAGWDARVRVYSAKTLKELAVLKWHKDGVSSTAFANVLDELGNTASAIEDGNSVSKSPLDIIREHRNLKAQRTHWLAAGGKDGKISLWDLF